MIRKRDIKLEWRPGDEPKPDDLNARVTHDLWRDGPARDLGAPGDLICHLVILSADMNGPSVTVHGEEGDDRFFCRYQAATQWTTLTNALDA